MLPLLFAHRDPAAYFVTVELVITLSPFFSTFILLMISLLVHVKLCSPLHTEDDLILERVSSLEGRLRV
jgi:hypothetical protein